MAFDLWWIMCYSVHTWWWSKCVSSIKSWILLHYWILFIFIVFMIQLWRHKYNKDASIFFFEYKKNKIFWEMPAFEWSLGKMERITSISSLKMNLKGFCAKKSFPPTLMLSPFFSLSLLFKQKLWTRYYERVYG